MSVTSAASQLRSFYPNVALPVFSPGWVWLVGAGPGDPGLLTLHSLNALEQADIIFHDALVDRAVLSLAPLHVERLFVGKRRGQPSIAQTTLSALLVEHARAGKRVLRLKGGDPFMFGRGGEEALALVAAGVPFRVYGGVSAGIGGLAQAGIAVTHREIGQSVTFLTGHGVGGAMPTPIDWQAVARASPTLVFYMAMAHLDLIATELIAAGRNPDDPVAIVANATLPSQHVVEASLQTMVIEARAKAIEPPAVVVIGEIVRLRRGLDWIGAITAGRVLDPYPLSES